MEMLQRHIEAPKFYDITLKAGMASKVIGNYAKASDDGSLIIFDGSDNVVGAFAAGEWRTFSSKLIPMVTLNTETGEEVLFSHDGFPYLQSDADRSGWSAGKKPGAEG